MDKNEGSVPSLPQTTPPPPQLGDSQWVIRELQNIRELLETRFNSLDERQRKTENTLSWTRGVVVGAAVILAILQVALRIFEVDVSLR